MKLFKLIMPVLAGAFINSNAAGQANASIAVLAPDLGNVAIGQTMYLQVNVGNTGPTNSIGIYKVRAQISVPAALVSINVAGSTLPAGWTVTSSTSSVINISNGSDIIPVGSSRTILIALQANALGGPSTVSGQLSFSNGSAPGTAPGTLSGDNTGDNTSSSAITVIAAPLPLTLLSFNATSLNCKPSLQWTTENEINTARFEVERAAANSSDWVLVGVKEAGGNTAAETDYSFTDNNVNTSLARQLYRLKMIDKDGQFTYSSTLPVSINCKTVQVSVFPNPVQNGKLSVSLTGTIGQAEAILMSVNGQVVLRSKVNNGTQMLNLANVPNGTYILNINDANGIVEKAKVIIQK